MMRKIIVSNLVTIDGYFEGPNQELDWFVVNEEFFEYARNLLRSVDGILYGRTTYEQMAEYWPHASIPENDPVITEKMNSLPKIVYSKTLSKASWNNSRIISGDLKEEIERLKNEPGGDLVIFGSGTLISGLAKLGLIDEYKLVINPVALGNGNPMFKNIGSQLKLELIDTTVFQSGVVIISYRPASQ